MKSQLTDAESSKWDIKTVNIIRCHTVKKAEEKA